MNTKKCNKCEKTLPVTEFYSDITKKDKLHTICKGCKKERRDYLKTVIAEYYDLFGGCVVCGYNKCSAAIDFHHIHSEHKEVAISKMSTSSEKRIREEIFKTIPLCKNCHMEYHHDVGETKDFFIKKHEECAKGWNL